MKVLALECSTAQAEVAIVDGQEVCYQSSFDAPRGRGGKIFLKVIQALKEGSKPDRIAVGIGPGSYNGLRTAIALAQGLSLGMAESMDQAIPLVGVPSPLALDVDLPDYGFVGDARGDSLHFTRVTRGRIVEDPRLISLSVWKDFYATIDYPIFSGDRATDFPVRQLSAVKIAQIAMVLLPSGNPIDPIYLKPPHITQPRKREG